MMKKFIASMLLALGLTSPSFGMTPEEAANGLYNSVGALAMGSREICTISKIGDRDFLTAAHCANVRVKVKGKFENERGQSKYVYFKSMTIGFLEKPDNKEHWEDWAVFHATADSPNVPALELDCQYTPKVGDPVAYMGFPYLQNTGGLVRLFGLGYVSGVFEKTEKKLGGHFTVDMPGAGGSSGSPIISMNSGKIIGILTRGEMGDRDVVGLIIESIKSTDMCENMPAVQEEEKEEVDPYRGRPRLKWKNDIQ